MPAWLLPLLLGGGVGAQLFGAKKGADASEKAADQQAQAAREALALQQRMFEQTRADLAPYREQGGQGLTALTALLGLPTSGARSTDLPPAASTAPRTAPPLPPWSNPQTLPRLAQEGFFGPGAIRIPREEYQRMRDMGWTTEQIAAATRSRVAAGPAGGNPLAASPGVRLRAPNGQIQVVPADQADFYVARGATRV